MIASDKLLVIGGSAGSLSAVLKIIPLLPKDSGPPVIIVMHRRQSEDTMLVDILRARTTYAVKEVDEKDSILPGIIYVAPADYHVLVEKGKTLSLDASEKVNYSRPSIDVTFESAADAYGPFLTCVLLSGANADGVEGLILARKKGSKIVVQDPATAEVPFMPKQAMESMEPDLILRESNLEELIGLLL